MNLNAREGVFGDTKVGALSARGAGDVAHQAGSQGGKKGQGGGNAGTMALLR